MRILDTFCGAGGAGMGYYRAGFEVVGVDIEPQPHYPFEFHQADALEYIAEHGHEFDAIHASPPCQRYSSMTKRWGRSESHPDLIAATRNLLIETGKPYIIENVVGAPLIQPILLCGSMFPSLQVRRHRLFELSFYILTMSCDHESQGEIVGVYGHSGGRSTRDNIKFHSVDDWRLAMGISWMTGRELAESIPPAYTQFIGAHLLEVLHQKQVDGVRI